MCSGRSNEPLRAELRRVDMNRVDSGDCAARCCMRPQTGYAQLSIQCR